MTAILRELFATDIPFVVQLTLSWMSIKVHHWLGQSVLIHAFVVRNGCEIGRKVGEHILQITLKLHPAGISECIAYKSISRKLYTALCDGHDRDAMIASTSSWGLGVELVSQAVTQPVDARLHQLEVEPSYCTSATLVVISIDLTREEFAWMHLVNGSG